MMHFFLSSHGVAAHKQSKGAEKGKKVEIKKINW
jgi:hypothetical protein